MQKKIKNISKTSLSLNYNTYTNKNFTRKFPKEEKKLKIKISQIHKNKSPTFLIYKCNYFSQ